MQIGLVPIQTTDSNGNTIYSGEYKPTYTSPEKLWGNISPARGETDLGVQFSETIQYDKVIVMDMSAPWIDEKTFFWIDSDPSTGVMHDYAAVRVAKSLNSMSIAIKKVSLS
jgi:hypothetical protein